MLRSKKRCRLSMLMGSGDLGSSLTLLVEEEEEEEERGVVGRVLGLQEGEMEAEKSGLGLKDNLGARDRELQIEAMEGKEGEEIGRAHV